MTQTEARLPGAGAGSIGFLMAYVPTLWNRPLIDESLARWDIFFGIDWPGLYRWVYESPMIEKTLWLAYLSMPYQIAFAVLVFSLTSDHARNNDLWWVAAISAAITSIVWGLWPSLGPLHHFAMLGNPAESLAPTAGGHVMVVQELRGGVKKIIHASQASGIVSFPSYHTAGALYLIYIFRSYRIFAGVLMLNILMLLAIPIIGEHYIADMAGGAAVVLCSIWITRRLMSALQSRQRTV